MQKLSTDEIIKICVNVAIEVTKRLNAEPQPVAEFAPNPEPVSSSPEGKQLTLGYLNKADRKLVEALQRGIQRHGSIAAYSARSGVSYVSVRNVVRGKKVKTDTINKIRAYDAKINRGD